MVVSAVNVSKPFNSRMSLCSPAATARSLERDMPGWRLRQLLGICGLKATRATAASPTITTRTPSDQKVMRFNLLTAGEVA
jgi:hypothetical protein